MPGLTKERPVLQERQNQSTVDGSQKSRSNDGDGVGGGRRTLKRNKTFAASQQQSPATNAGGGRRHRRGTKGRYTVPLMSAPNSPMVSSKYAEPLRIQTSHEIFEEAFGCGKRNSLNRQQIHQLTAALALPERSSKQISPAARSATSSSGFGSAEALPNSSRDSSSIASPRSDISKIESKDKKVSNLHFWLLLCIQYLLHYLQRLSIPIRAAKHQPETTPVAKKIDFVPVEPIKNFAPSLRNARSRRIAGVKRKLHFEDEIENRQETILQKPFYTELHLGRENQRSTSLAAIEADRSEYSAKKLLSRAAETQFVTTVFEIRLRGLEEIAGSVVEEVQRWYGEHDSDAIVVCCEMQWSTPDRFRNVVCESRMKDDLARCLRSNNRRVVDAVARRNEKAKKFNRLIVFPESIVEEVGGRKRGALKCWSGSYRRYYGDLLPWSHREAAAEHQPWWELKRHTMPESIDWPLIASIDKTSVIMLNLVCLKLNEL